MRLCECGCGQPAPIATFTNRRYDHVAGQPQRFVRGHASRLQTRAATRYGMKYQKGGQRIYAHRLRAERAVGRALRGAEQVHHVDGSTSSDSPLVICPDMGYHKQLHARQRIKRAGGNPFTQAICAKCKVVKDHEAFCKASRRWNGRHARCRACSSQAAA